MNYKDFKDYPSLIDILKNRNLIVKDEKQAIKFLEKNHYYRLSSYFIPFQHPKNSPCKDMFQDGTTFEDIVLLYNFDTDLRKFVFNYLSELEIILRAQISHIHSKQYKPFGYIQDIKSLKREMRIKDRCLYGDLIEQIDKEKKRASEDFIQHIKTKYNTDDLPLWALVEILSFGTLSKFVKLMQKTEQLDLMKFFELENIQIDVFENWIETLSYVRNLCAHHSRLWNRQFVKKFKYRKNDNFLDENVDRDKIFFAVSVLTIILKEYNIKEEFIKLLNKYPSIDKAAMGIPQNWQELNIWK
ncbi:Abi family protein [Campylobacter lari]|uniref:Abi family protein n=1 Tax=unclassified Campylobacter TaxID=2593542 RepID=UPI00138EBB8C|nr:Abi family protein [Campylobacter sp. IFREMER_LSEM_CL2194]EAJ6152960.1 Abi family protein [Campylobacter lari]MCR8683754.1 Abi family protein [Campylobacter sp. LMG 17559]EAK5578114.1 Abi family protein [Campylobacter lari]EGK7485905.1 Abi family protein [Campylobacter lari]EGK8077126.1 Abi family protein [Campylobacter lari]